MVDLSRLNNFLFGKPQSLPDSRGMGVIDRPIRHLPSHRLPPKPKVVPDTVFRMYIKNQSEFKPIHVFLFHELHFLFVGLDSGLVKFALKRLLKLQDLILRLKSKDV